MLLATTAGLATLPAIARAQTTIVLDPTSLSCTRDSIDLGISSLPVGLNAAGDPQCSETRYSAFDEITYYASVNCVVCGPGTDFTIAIARLQVQIGLNNGPCPVPVQVYFQGAAYPPSGLSPAYVGGSLITTGAGGKLSLYSSVDCTDPTPTYSGNIGANSTYG
jgi:hypothetical protein